MLMLLKVKYFQFLEHWHQHSFMSACRFALYHMDEEVPVVKELDDLPPKKVPAEGLQLVEITPENFSHKPFEYPLRSREERSGLYFKNGFCALVMVREGQAVGDLWYVTPSMASSADIHPDVQRLKLDLAVDDVYMFDMHVGSDQRGGGVATFLLNSALHYLHDKGYRKAFGYYSADNVPALWVHRLLGYKELPPYIVRRFLLYRTARAK